MVRPTLYQVVLEQKLKEFLSYLSKCLKNLESRKNNYLSKKSPLLKKTVLLFGAVPEPKYFTLVMLWRMIKYVISRK